MRRKRKLNKNRDRFWDTVGGMLIVKNCATCPGFRQMWPNSLYYRIIDQELLTNNFTPFLLQAPTRFLWRWVYSKSKMSGQLSPTRGVRGMEGGPIPRFGGLIYPIITTQENLSQASLWVGDCKNTIAYQIWRGGHQVSWGPIPRFGGSIYPIITTQANLSQASLWVGDCKNAIAYQIWRWDP